MVIIFTKLKLCYQKMEDITFDRQPTEGKWSQKSKEVTVWRGRIQLSKHNASYIKWDTEIKRMALPTRRSPMTCTK